MAKLLFIVPPLVGHLNPALAVAHEMQGRGHSVAWALHAHKMGHLLPAQSRLFDIGTEHSVTSIESPQVRGLESVRLFFEDYAIPMAREVFPALVKAIEQFEPDLLVVDHQMVAGALAGTAQRKPWVNLATTSASILKFSDTLDEWVGAQYQALQEEFLPVALHRARPDFSPLQVIVFSSEVLIPKEQPRVDAPYAFVGPCRPAGRRAVEFPWEALRQDSAKILLSLGTVSRDRDLRFYRVFMEAAQRIPELQLIMVAPDVLQAEAPANVLVRDHVPQMELLKHMDAVVCHAGHNTVFESLQQGLPLGLAPIRDDQPVVARLVIDAGAGVFIRHGKVTVNMAEQVLRQLLKDEALKAKAAELAQTLGTQDGTRLAADCLEQHLNTLKPMAEVD